MLLMPIQLKVNRVKELEALLLEMRSKEFRTGSASQSTHERIQALEERNRILGDQASYSYLVTCLHRNPAPLSLKVTRDDNNEC